MPRKILIIDDDRVLRKKLKKALVSEDFYVLEADNGISGLKLAAAENPDLIFMDLILPKISGIELLKNLYKNISQKNIPVMVHTNLVYPAYIGKAVDLGVRVYLIKSLYSTNELLKKINSTLQQTAGYQGEFFTRCFGSANAFISPSSPRFLREDITAP